jgi:hypothetical protein
MFGCRTIRMICNSRFWKPIRVSRIFEEKPLTRTQTSPPLPKKIKFQSEGTGRTLKRLSCNTLLMAASSPFGDIFVWKTTPKEPFPTILHCVYCISLVSPVNPSWTFWRTTSVRQRRGFWVRVIHKTTLGQGREGKKRKSLWRDFSNDQRRGTYLPFATPKTLLAYFVT